MQGITLSDRDIAAISKTLKTGYSREAFSVTENLNRPDTYVAFKNSIKIRFIVCFLLIST